VDRCRASPLGDCDGPLSDEHIVSAGLLPGPMVSVSGFDWCKGIVKGIPVSPHVNAVFSIPRELKFLPLPVPLCELRIQPYPVRNAPLKSSPLYRMSELAVHRRSEEPRLRGLLPICAVGTTKLHSPDQLQSKRSRETCKPEKSALSFCVISSIASPC
jgi:hypothetical protein